MSDGACIALRIFTGPHAGAEIVLKSGSWLWGTDEACDIILHDSSMAPCHMRLSVEEDAGNVSEVRVFPLEGTVTADGRNLDDGASLPPATPCFLGLTCLAWAVPREAESAWIAAARTLRPILRPDGASPADTFGEAPEEPEAPLPPTTNGAQPPTSLPDVVVEGAPPSAGLSARRRWLRCASLLLLAVLLAALCLNPGRFMDEYPPSTDELRRKLVEAGLEQLEIVADENGLRVRGQLPTDKERGQLVRLAQSMQYPVRLDVRVESDMADALTDAFSSRGLYPEVRMEETEGAKRFRVAGYMKDGIVEAWALAGAREDLPFLEAGDHRLVPHILHAEDVNAVLGPALTLGGLGGADVLYLPGTIEISGSLDTAQRASLDRILRETQRRLGIPLKVIVRENGPDLRRQAAAPARIPASDAARTPPAEASGFGFKVVGVTMRPLRFISLESGERVFAGGVLPGGYTLETITTTRLILRRDGQQTIYPLRGSR